MPGLNDGSSQQNAFEWDLTQVPGGTRVLGTTVSPFGGGGNTQDWWALYLVAGTTYVFQTRLPTAWQTQLYLYDSNGYYLQFSSSGGDDGFSLSKITYAVTQDGWYFLALTGYYYGGQFGPYVLESVPAPKSFKTYATSASRCSARMPIEAPAAARFTAVKDPVVASQGSRFNVRKKQTAADTAHFSPRYVRTGAVASRLSLQKIATVSGNLCRFVSRAKVTGNTPSRLTARAMARRDILSRLAMRATAIRDVPSRFSMTSRVGVHQIARHNAFVPPGWNLYARDTATGIAIFLGHIPIDADPRELTDVAIPDGAFEIEVRPAQFFWQNTRTRPITTLITAPTEPPLTGIPGVQNLRAAVIAAQTVITWNISTDIAPAPGLQFGVWFSPTSPVDTSGAPAATVGFTPGVGEYQTVRAQSANEYIAVAAMTPGAQGPAAELYLPWNVAAMPSPANQLAADAPIPNA